MNSLRTYIVVLWLLSVCAAAQQNPPVPEKPEQPAATLPDAPSASVTPPPSVNAEIVSTAGAYVPLTRREKLDRWLAHTHSPYMFTSVLFNATWAQMVGDWPTYGGGMEGYGKRVGASLANSEVSGFFKVYLLPTLMHQDPRYFRSQKKHVVARGLYAATRVLITRDDDGDNTFNASEVLGTLFTASVSNAYYPRRDRGFGETMTRTSGALISDAGANVLREFWPDIRKLFRRHAPEKVKRIEQSIPKPIEKAVGPSE